MNIITLDFETYYDDEYSLKKMSMEEYVRDPRFEVHGCGVRFADGSMEWLKPDGLKGIDFSNSAVLCHHAQFDGLILSHHYGIKPGLWLDTLSMARMVHGNHVSVGLDSLAKLHGLSGKNVPYDLFKGRRWNNLGREVQRQLADGCLHDVALTWELFSKLSVGFPSEEYALIDMTIRMFTEPVLEGDLDLLSEIWYEERDRKEKLLREMGLNSKDLQSAERFAELLRQEGIEPETKISPKGREIFAFAKTDDFMRELQESENERLSGLVEARLGLKSTLNQTRAETIGGSASRGSIPIYLASYAAHTTRWGGGDNINWQNLPRGGKLRRSLLAPKGYKICVVDLSQIEARLLATLAGQWDLVKVFRDKGDPYVDMAKAIYPGEEIDKHKRGTGKQLILSAGYGSGPEKAQKTGKLGTYGPPVDLPLSFWQRAINLYRLKNNFVVGLWLTAGRMIARLAGGDPLEWGPLLIKDKRLWLPNGSCVIYDTLHFNREAREWQYQTRKGWNKLYGAKLCQHICEALGRLILGQAAIRLLARGYRMRMTVHDEGLFLIRHEEESNIILEEFERQVEWLPELPVAAEVTVGERYEK